jgi:hypothetical protein
VNSAVSFGDVRRRFVSAAGHPGDAEGPPIIATGDMPVLTVCQTLMKTGG